IRRNLMRAASDAAGARRQGPSSPSAGTEGADQASDGSFAPDRPGRWTFRPGTSGPTERNVALRTVVAEEGIPPILTTRGPEMSVQTAPEVSGAKTNGHHDDKIELRRSTIDKLLISFGVIAAMVLAAAGGLLTWGANF